MNKYLLILITLSLTSCALLNPNPNRKEAAAAIELKLRPFTTDYCSEWPDGKFNDPKQWASCCFTHDLHYWLGGTAEEKSNSDKELKQCVKLKGSTFNGFLMYMGVRLGGTPGDASYAWGYGWTQDRVYTPVSVVDAETAKSLLEKSELNKGLVEKKLIQSFIENKLKTKLKN